MRRARCRQLIVDKSLSGWKELEYEVVRDAKVREDAGAAPGFTHSASAAHCTEQLPRHLQHGEL
jgi:hypothetical protein